MLIWSRKGRAAAGALAVTLFAGVFLLPLAVILLSSLSKQWNGLLPTGFTFAHFVNAFRGAAWDSLFSSLMVGFCASLLALLCGMWAALALRQYGATLQKYLGLAFYLPSAIPSVSVGLGILVAFSQGPLQMNGTFFIVLAAHFVLISAFTFSNVTTGLARISADIENVASSLGASPWYRLRHVTLPLMTPWMISALALSLSLSMGELGATVMIYPPGWTTLPVTIFSLTDRGNIADGSALTIVLVGGIKSISSFAEKVVPLMALAYVIGSIFILVKFGSNIPHVFAMIFEYAFTPMAATGGFAGSTVMLAIRWGLARGVYSNEAGTGMAPLAHSSSSANHPVKQGLWGISEVFVDTIIVCTMTALVVLCTGVWTEGGTGAALTATAFGAGFGNAIAGTVFVVAIITFFAFTTALVNVYYGEICMTVLGGKKFILPYRLLGCAFAIIGSVGALSVLWNLFDFFFGVCAVCNLVVCFLMRKQIGALINDYLTRLKSGKWEPTSEAAANAIPELWVNDKTAK